MNDSTGETLIFCSSRQERIKTEMYRKAEICLIRKKRGESNGSNPTGSSYLVKLRDFYPSLEELCASLGIEQQEIEEKLGKLDYHYEKTKNQFL